MPSSDDETEVSRNLRSLLSYVPIALVLCRPATQNVLEDALLKSVEAVDAHAAVKLLKSRSVLETLTNIHALLQSVSSTGIVDVPDMRALVRDLDLSIVNSTVQNAIYDVLGFYDQPHGMPS